MKKHITTILLIVIFLVGLSLMLYPTVSDYVNSLHQSRAIASYSDAVQELDDNEYEKLLKQAHKYNSSMKYSGPSTLSGDEYDEYYSNLNVSGNGIMGYIEIPKIKCSLPIYHGTDESVLQIAIGHIEGTSLPVGGKGTHCVLSGHRGLPSAKLFSNLDEMEVGDKFVIRVLDETLTYEVESINTVLPYEISSLTVREDSDLCTLVTCTPYGINTHRLLVTGHRTENEKDVVISTKVTAEASLVNKMIVAPILAAPMLIALFIFVLIKTKPKKKKKK